MAPSPHFVHGILANLTYWQAELDRAKGGSSMPYKTSASGLLTAIHYGLALPETQTSAALLLIACFRRVEQWGYWSNWMPYLHRATAQAEHLAPSIHIQLLNRLGHLQRLNQQVDKALSNHTRAEKLCQKAKVDIALLAETYVQLGEDYRHLRQYDLANKYGLLALANLNEGENYWPVALNNLGLIAWEQGELAAAVTYLEKAVACWEQWEQTTQIGRSLLNLGIVKRQQENYEAAHVSLQKAADWLMATDSELDKLKVENEKGILHFQQADYTQAELAFRQADHPFLHQSGNMHMRAALAQNLGNTLLKQGKLVEAEYEIDRAISLWRLTKDEIELANSLGTQAEIKMALAQNEAAISYLAEALDLLKLYPQNAWARKLANEFCQMQLSEQY